MIFFLSEYLFFINLILINNGVNCISSTDNKRFYLINSTKQLSLFYYTKFKLHFLKYPSNIHKTQCYKVVQIF